MKNKLDEARKIINEVDKEMAELFTKRMRAVELVCEYKKEHGLPILDQERENAVIEKNSSLINDDFLKEYYTDYLRHLMSISRTFQYRMQDGLQVAYLGAEGSFSHIAAEKLFPGSTFHSYEYYEDAYNSVLHKINNILVTPLNTKFENSGELFINGIYELEGNSNFETTYFAVLSKV